jgi:hypothetical protein
MVPLHAMLQIRFWAGSTSALLSFNLGVVDLAEGPSVLGSLARSTTSTPVLYLDTALARKRMNVTIGVPYLWL